MGPDAMILVFWVLISGSSAFSKTSLNIWKFTVHVLLKPGLENFKHYFTSLWDECNCVVVWVLFSIAFLGLETDLFQSCGHCWVFQICWHIECGTFTASSFRFWNSSTGIPSPPLALFVVMLPKAFLTSHSRILALREWSHYCDYLGHQDLFCTVLCILATSSMLGPYHFCPVKYRCFYIFSFYEGNSSVHKEG